MAAFSEALGEAFVLIRGDFGSLGPDLDKAEKQVKDRLKGISDAFGTIGKGLSVGLTAPIVAIGAAIGTVGMQFDGALKAIRSGSGATGKDLDSLGTSFRNVWAIAGEPPDQIAKALTDIHVRTGQTGESLEKLTDTLLALSGIAKSDIEPLVASTTRLFGDWSVSTDKQVTSLDFLWKVSQQTGIGVEALSNKLVQFGAPLRQFGFSLEESAVLMGKWEKEGVNSELVLGSLRIAMGKFAQENIPLREGLQATVTEIQRLGPGAEATSMAMKIFGARAGPDMAAAILEGRFAIDGLMKSIKASDDTIQKADDASKSLGDRFAELKNQVSAAIAPLGLQFVKSLEGIIPSLIKVASSIGTAVEWFSKLPPGVQTAVFAIGALLAAIGPAVIVLGSMAGGVVKLIEVTKALGIAQTASTAATITSTGATTVATGATGIFSGALTVLGGAFRALLSVLGPVSIAIAAVWAAWKVGNIEGVKNQIAEWTLRLQGMTKEQAHSAVQATAAAVAANAQAQATAAAIPPTTNLTTAVTTNTRQQSTNTAAVDAAVAAGLRNITNVGKQATAVEDFTKKLRDFGGELKGFQNLSNEEFLKVFGSNLDDAALKMKQFGITGRAVPPEVAAAMLRLQNVRISDWIKEDILEMQRLQAQGVPILEGLGSAAIAADERVTAAIGKGIELRAKAREDEFQTRQDSSFVLAEMEIENAKRSFVNVETIARMEADLRKAKLDAAIADSNRQFVEETRNMDLTTQAGRDALEAMKSAHQAAIDSMVINWQAGEQQKQQATYSFSQGFAGIMNDLPNIVTSIFSKGGLTSSLMPHVDNMLGGLKSKITGALPGIFGGPEGGGGIFGSILNTGLGALLGPAGPLSGLMTAGINALAGLAMKGLSKLGGWIKGLFGGPSEQEKEGREVAGNFRNGLLDGLNPGQMAEVQQAIQGAWKGNEVGAATIIAIRDAYIKAGAAAEDATVDANRLWEAEKQGGDAVARVIAEIEAKMKGPLTGAMQTVGAAGQAAFSTVANSAQTSFNTISIAIDGVQRQFRQIVNELGQPILVPIEFQLGDVPPMPSGGGGGGSSGGGGGGSSSGGGGGSSPPAETPENREERQAASKAAVQAAIARGGKLADDLRQFMSSNPGDWDRAARNYGLSFAQGGFIKPGEVVPATLHGGMRGEVITPLGDLERFLSDRADQPMERSVQNTVQFNLSTPLATVDTIRQMVYDEIGPLFLQWLEGNKSGARTRARTALGIA